MIKSICNTERARPFLHPVDPVDEEAPDYFDVIKKPIDLSTIRSKVFRNEYASAQDITSDFSQMVRNSVMYNGEYHFVTMSARAIRDISKQWMRRLPEDNR